MMNFHKPHCFFLLILLTLFFNLTFSAGEILDNQEEQESEEFENALLENVRKDYKNRFGELVNFINSINNTITALNAEIVGLKASKTGQQKQIRDLKQAVYNRKLNLSWEDFDEFIRSIETQVKTGNSLEGSTFQQIKSRASEVGKYRSYTVFVFANHLDETIQDFKIYDPRNSINNPAPKSIPPHTQEMFTFAHPAYHYVMTSFSYFIPSARVRIAAISALGVEIAGLAFVSNDANMKTYFDTKKGIEGSWVIEQKRETDKNLSVSYKNFQARLFAEHEGVNKATIRIELVQLPL